MPVAVEQEPKQPVTEDVTLLIPKKALRARPLFDPPIVKRAIRASFVKTVIRRPSPGSKYR